MVCRQVSHITPAWSRRCTQCTNTAIIGVDGGVGPARALWLEVQQYAITKSKLLVSWTYQKSASSTFANGEFISRQSHWWTGLKHCHRPNFLMIGQADIERALESKLTIPVHRNHEASKIEEFSIDGEDFVRTEFPNTVVISKYAVGADGARSIVRSQLNIPFEGTKPNMIWHVLDTFLDTDFPVAPEIITFQVNGQARVSWIPRFVCQATVATCPEIHL